MLLLFHSYIILNFRTISENLYLAFGLWKEILFVILLLSVLIKKMFSKVEIKEKKVIVIVSILLCYGVGLGFVNEYDLKDVILNARDFMLPFCFFIVLSNNAVKYKYSIKYINYLIIILFAIHGGISIHNYVTFDGSIDKIWVSSHFSNIEKGVEFHESNYIRNEKLRAIGLFSSPLEYSMSILLPLFLSIYYVICLPSFPKKLIMLFVFALFLVSAYVANVRTWVIGLVLGIAVTYFVKKYKDRKILGKVIFIVIPLVAIAATFVFLLSGLTSDLSALGRIDQYITVPLKIIEKPAGLGFGNVGPKGSISADSNILSLPLAFGIVGALLYIYLTLYLFFRLLDYSNLIFNNKRMNVHYKVLYFSMISYGAAYIYVSAFQYSLFYGIQYLLFILIALLLNKFTENKLSFSDTTASSNNLHICGSSK